MNKDLTELAIIFFKLGLIGFGGPAAHIAMMEDEVVNRRQWITKEYFLDLIGATNLIPGPNSTEMAIHIGYIRAGLAGLVVAGVCFIFPAVLITTGFAWIYVTFGSLPQISPLFYGIKSVVIAIIFAALWRLAKSAIKSQKLLFISLFIAIAAFSGLNEVAAIILGGFIGMLILMIEKTPISGAIVLPFTTATTLTTVSFSNSTSIVNVSLWQLGLFFLKIGSVLYGGGYVLVAFLQSGLVEELKWLTQQQLLDAVAIGQFTPGPISSTATFIGYVIAGIPGAVVATIGIFLPSFIFVLILNPIIPRLRSSKWMSAFLDAVNVSAFALMAVVTIKLALAIIFLNNHIDWIAVFIALTAGIILMKWKVNAAWIVLGGAIIGLIFDSIF
jgi:chromate transporter